jgi:hypothetical protein
MSLFKRYINNFGTLTWEFDPPARRATFLDLNIELTNQNNVRISLHEKELNLHLYIPSHSAHPPGILKSLIFGRILHSYRITRKANECAKYTKQLSAHLRARGYDLNWLRPIFNQAYRNAITQFDSNLEMNKEKDETISENNKVCALFAHVAFNPCDPTSHAIQRVFTRRCANPPNEQPLATFTSRSGRPPGNDWLIVAYHRPMPHKLKGSD